MKLFLNGSALAAIALLAVTPAAAEDSAQLELSRGIVRSLDEAWLSSDLGLPIEFLPLKEGESFRRNDVLVRFDCSTLKAQLKAADARLQAELIGLKNNKQLKAHNAIGQFDVDISEAKVDQAEAERDVIAVSVQRCEIKAPFDGQVAQLGVHLHEVPERGARFMQVLDSTALEVDMILPSAWLKWLKPGAAFEIHIDELQEARSAEVVRIAAAVDPVSQTVKVVGRLTGETGRVQPGMSGSLTFWNGQ
jgi:RND family efflux transporter MFP subunit